MLKPPHGVFEDLPGPRPYSVGEHRQIFGAFWAIGRKAADEPSPPAVRVLLIRGVELLRSVAKWAGPSMLHRPLWRGVPSPPAAHSGIPIYGAIADKIEVLMAGNPSAARELDIGELALLHPPADLACAYTG